MAVSMVCRLVVGTVWIVAGALKLPDPAESVRAVRNYRLLPELVVPFVGTALPVLEIALGLLLVVGLATRAASALSATVLGLFILGIASAWARGLDIDCGCFGGGGAGDGDPYGYAGDILRDLGLVAASAYVFLRAPGYLALDRRRSAVADPTRLTEREHR